MIEKDEAFTYFHNHSRQSLYVGTDICHTFSHRPRVYIHIVQSSDHKALWDQQFLPYHTHKLEIPKSFIRIKCNKYSIKLLCKIFKMQ